MPEPRRNNNAMMYVKLAVSIVLVGYVVAFVIFNSQNHAEVWLVPFMAEQSMPTLMVIFITALLSTLGWWLGAQLYRAWRRRRRGSGSGSA